jgi:hypothetical protein
LADELPAPGFRSQNISTSITDNSYVGVQGARKWIVDTCGGLDAAVIGGTTEQAERRYDP